jgi:glyoxylase-like metal-dependent hydrolase (beta-lactamase superfamily II)
MHPIGGLLLNGQSSGAPARLICHCLLLEMEEQLVLVDTGFGLDDMHDLTGRIGRLPASIFRVEQDPTRCAVRQIQALGYDPHDVRDIVLTHLDFDQTGGLPDFPWAKVHVLDLEHQAAMYPANLMERNRYSGAHFSHSPDWELHSMKRGERWFGFENVNALSNREPSVLLIPLFGHSRGHCGVAVLGAEGWLLHAGDAILHHSELDPVHPDAPLRIRVIEHLMKDDTDALEMNQALLRQLAHEQQGKVQIVCTHDPDMLDGIPPSVRSAYAG